MSLSRVTLSVLTIGVMLFMGATAVTTADEEEPYTVACGPDPESGAKKCKVDKGTYIGYRTYSSYCLRCHGQDGVGSSFAPSLLDKLKEVSKERFMNSVANGYTGQTGIMPPWKNDPNVNKRYDELYAYLRARADGVLLPGRPQRIDR